MTEGDTLFQKVSSFRIAKNGAEIDLFSPKVTLLAKIGQPLFLMIFNENFIGMEISFNIIKNKGWPYFGDFFNSVYSWYNLQDLCCLQQLQTKVDKISLKVSPLVIYWFTFYERKFRLISLETKVDEILLKVSPLVRKYQFPPRFLRFWKVTLFEIVCHLLSPKGDTLQIFS